MNSPYYQTAPLGQTEAVALAPPSAAPSTTMTVYRFAGAGAAAVLAFHGYRRTGSIGWALAWALGGGLVWPIGIGIALAQGFGKPAVRSNRRRGSR